jgi:hypothetical protein
VEHGSSKESTSPMTSVRVGKGQRLGAVSAAKGLAGAMILIGLAAVAGTVCSRFCNLYIR